MISKDVTSIHIYIKIALDRSACKPKVFAIDPGLDACEEDGQSKIKVKTRNGKMKISLTVIVCVKVRLSQCSVMYSLHLLGL